MDKELQSHKNSDKIKWIITAIAFVLVFALLGGLYALQFRIGDDKSDDSPSTEASKTVMQSIKAVPVVYADNDAESSLSVMPYASASNGVTKPSDDVLQAEINSFMSQNGFTRYDVSNYSSFAKAEVKNNIDDTVITVGSVINKYGALLSSGNTFFTVLFPKFNPFESLLDEGYGVEKVREVNGMSSAVLAGTLEHYYTFQITLSNLSNYGSKYFSYSLVFVGNTVPLPADPVKEGYDFVGWYYGTQNEHNSNSSCKAYDGAPIYADTSLHAHFKIKTFSVTFDSAGGSSVSAKKVDWNTSVSAPTCERKGYDFLGWYLSDGTKYTGQAIKADTVLIAHWQIQKFTVTFYVDGEEYDTVEVEYGTALSEVESLANSLGLRVKSYSPVAGEALGDSITYDLNVNADTVQGGVNLWQIIGGVVGGVVLIALIAGVISAVKRKRY